MLLARPGRRQGGGDRAAACGQPHASARRKGQQPEHTSLTPLRFQSRANRRPYGHPAQPQPLLLSQSAARTHILRRCSVQQVRPPPVLAPTAVAAALLSAAAWRSGGQCSKPTTLYLQVPASVYCCKSAAAQQKAMLAARRVAWSAERRGSLLQGRLAAWAAWRGADAISTQCVLHGACCCAAVLCKTWLSSSFIDIHARSLHSSRAGVHRLLLL